MTAWATVIGCYSLEPGIVGKPIGEDEVVEYATGMDALLALDDAMDNMPRLPMHGYRFLVRTPDGRHVSFNDAYMLVTGKEPVRHTNSKTLYPMLRK